VTDVARLVRAFYDELWNAWDDAPVPDTLHPELRFRGSLGQETHGLQEWRAYRDGVRRGSAGRRHWLSPARASTSSGVSSPRTPTKTVLTPRSASSA
jgi:hypothetical protein